METKVLRAEDATELFPQSCILSCSPNPTNTFAEHVLEDGGTVSDNKIINNVEISVVVILPVDDAQRVFNDIQSASENTTELIVQTRFFTFARMYIQSYPWSESSDIVNTASINVTLKQQRTATVKTTTLPPSSVKNQSNADTVNRGEQLPKSETILSQAGRWFGV